MNKNKLEKSLEWHKKQLEVIEKLGKEKLKLIFRIEE